MKLSLCLIVLTCVVGLSLAWTEAPRPSGRADKLFPRPSPTFPKPPAQGGFNHRFRREADPGKDKDVSRGKWGADIYREDGVGTVGKVHGSGRLWESDDGKSKVEAHGEWSKVLEGPQKSRPNHREGISFSHDF